MKKMLTLILSLSTATAIFAQGGYRNDRQYNDNKPNVYESPRQNDDRNRRDDRTTVYNHNDNNYGYDNNRHNEYDRRFKNERERQAERDRINREYDRRIDAYRHDRRMNERERARMIEAQERERNSKLKTIGGALLIGGIIGVLLAHH